VWVDPHNPDVVLVAALGRTFSPNADRGVFKTADGGKTWRKVLYKDDVTGRSMSTLHETIPDWLRGIMGTLCEAGNPRALLDNMSGAGIYKTADGAKRGLR